MKIDDFTKKLNEDRVVPCKLCGKETPYIRIEMCTQCWDMEKGVRLFILANRNKAKEWLQEQLNDIKV